MAQSGPIPNPLPSLSDQSNSEMKNITCQQSVFILLPFSRCDCMLVGAEKSSETENDLRITHFERQLSQITKEKMNMVHSRRCSHVEEECQTLATALRRPIARHISATRRQKDAENENRAFALRFACFARVLWADRNSSSHVAAE